MLQIPALIALGVGAKVAARVAPKLYDKYKKLKTKAKAAKTRNDKKKAVDAANKAAQQVQNAANKAKIKGYSQQNRLGSEKLKQSKLKTKQMKKGFGNTNKGNLAKDAVQGTGKLLGATLSGARTGLSRGTGYFGRSGDPRRRFRKYVSSPIGIGYAGSEKSDSLIKELGGDKIVDFKKKMKSFKTGGKITYKVDNQGQDFVKKMYGGKVKK